MGETQHQRRDRQERFAQAQLVRLNGLANSLDALIREVFDNRVAYTPDNGSDVMALSFVTKQHEHLRSVRTLINAGLHRDAYLIARTMLEGLARLLWAFNRSPERTDLWFWFGAILDWRQILKNEAGGMAVEPGEKAELKAYVDSYGPNYYTKKVRDALQAAEKEGAVFEVPDDPWRNDWTANTTESMFHEVHGEYLYEGPFRDTSEWIHWGPRSIFRAMEPAEWGMGGFTQEDWRAAASALMYGCLSVLHSLEILDQHFSLGITPRLADLGSIVDAINAEAATDVV